MVLMVIAASGSMDILGKAIGVKNVLPVHPSACLISVLIPDDVEDPCRWTRDRIFPVLRHLPGTVAVVEIRNMASNRGGRELVKKIKGWDPDTMADLSDA